MSKVATVDYILCVIFRSPCSFFHRRHVFSICFFHQTHFLLSFARFIYTETESIDWTFLTVILFFIIILSNLAFFEIHYQSESSSIYKWFNCFIELSYDLCFKFNDNL